MAEVKSPDLLQTGISPEAVKKSASGSSEDSIVTPQVSAEQIAVNDKKEAEELAQARDVIEDAQEQQPQVEQPEPKPKGPVILMPMIMNRVGHGRAEDLDNVDPNDVLDNSTRNGRNRATPPGGRRSRGMAVAGGLWYAVTVPFRLLRGGAKMMGHLLYEQPGNYIKNPDLQEFLSDMSAANIGADSVVYQQELLQLLRSSSPSDRDQIAKEYKMFKQASKSSVHRSESLTGTPWEKTKKVTTGFFSFLEKIILWVAEKEKKIK